MTRRQAQGPGEPVDVAIVGAGFAGIAMALALRRAGRESFVVLERADRSAARGATTLTPAWRATCPSHLYGFAEHPNPDWSGLFARGGEIRDYLERRRRRECATACGCAPRSCAPDGTAKPGSWMSGRRAHRGRPLVLACGRLTEPADPRHRGLESFPGPLFHSARWDHGVDVSGAVARDRERGERGAARPRARTPSAHVTLFQRSPAWIVPRGAREYSDASRTRFAEHPEELAACGPSSTARARRATRRAPATPPPRHAAREAVSITSRAQVADSALRAALTPDYAFGCKRVLLSDEFYPAVASDAVTLEASALVDASRPHARRGRAAPATTSMCSCSRRVRGRAAALRRHRGGERGDDPRRRTGPTA